MFYKAATFSYIVGYFLFAGVAYNWKGEGRYILVKLMRFEVWFTTVWETIKQQVLLPGVGC